MSGATPGSSTVVCCDPAHAASTTAKAAAIVGLSAGRALSSLRKSRCAHLFPGPASLAAASDTVSLSACNRSLGANVMRGIERTISRPSNASGLIQINRQPPTTSLLCRVGLAPPQVDRRRCFGTVLRSSSSGELGKL